VGICGEAETYGDEGVKGDRKKVVIEDKKMGATPRQRSLGKNGGSGIKSSLETRYQGF